MHRKNYNGRAVSPIRSPLNINTRPVSPLRCSPFNRQVIKSPLKMRNALNASNTPKRGNFNQRVAFLDKSPQNNIQSYQTGFMQKTLKNGIGLFQQLAHQNKIGSEKKQNKLPYQNLPPEPFQFSQRKKECFGNYPKNSFAALIQNVKQIQSIKASKNNSSNNPISFKTTIQKSRQMDSGMKAQKDAKFQSSQNYNLLQSFGNPSQPHPVQIISKQLIKNNYKAPNVQEQKKQAELVTKFQPETKPSPEMISSFEDVILLIRKASQKIKDDSLVSEQQVKKSLNESISFNMNPFL